VLLRRVIGDALRARRQEQHRTLREISTAANVSLGYLSEIERGQKEASSELLAAICDALGSGLSEVLRDASDHLARAERADGPLTGAAPTDAALTEDAISQAGTEPLAPAGAEVPVQPSADRSVATVTDGQVSVSVHRNGPLRTTLHAVRLRHPGATRTS
jgi:transcriptional regulator with XRE-family HTH domain